MRGKPNKLARAANVMPLDVLNSESVIPPTYAHRVIPRKGEIRDEGMARIALALNHVWMAQSDDPTRFYLHVHLRSWRKSRKLTLEALAEQMGSKVSTLSGWETGRRILDLEDLQKLALYYGVHPADFFSRQTKGW